MTPKLAGSLNCELRGHDPRLVIILGRFGPQVFLDGLDWLVCAFMQCRLRLPLVDNPLRFTSGVLVLIGRQIENLR